MSIKGSWQELHLIQYDNEHFDLKLITRTKKLHYKELLGDLEYQNYLLNKTKTSKTEVERIVKSRAKRKIRALALCNKFQYFSTITINSKNADRYSLEESELLLKKQLHKMHRLNNLFQFIIIIEKHKDGAFHFHGLTGNFPVDDLYINDNGYLSSHLLDELGYNSFLEIQENKEDYDYCKVVSYITKYIMKDTTRSTGNQLYFCSRNLQKPLRNKLNLAEFSQQFKDFQFQYDDDFVKTTSLNIDKPEDDELYKRLSYIDEDRENSIIQFFNDKLIY